MSIHFGQLLTAIPAYAEPQYGCQAVALGGVNVQLPHPRYQDRTFDSFQTYPIQC